MRFSGSMLAVALAAATFFSWGCHGRGDRGGGGGGGGGSDASADGSASGTDGGGAGTDGATPGTDGGGTGTDGGGTGTDGGSGAQGTCDPACLEGAGAMCCTDCGCGGATVRCEPRCESPFMWDCEIGCCFDYTTYECACPAGTEWDAESYCCKDTGGTCVLPAP